MIEPFVEFLRRHGPFYRNLKGPHIVTAYLAVLIVLALVAHGVAPGLTRHAGTLYREVRKLVDGLSTGEVATRLASQYQWTEEEELRLKTFLLHHCEDIQGIIGSAERLTSTLIGAIFVIPILAIFFLSSGAQLTDEALRLLAPRENYGAVRSLADQLNTMLRSYIKAMGQEVSS